MKSLDILQQLDLIYAKAKYSIEIKGNKPFLKEFGSLKIVEARHPILLLRHPREKITPLSIELGNGYNTLLITGPNAGGKSVAMKTVGVLVLMLQCGIHIPASPDSEFPIFKKLYVDIGDDQSIENDLSTFSSHITMLKGILNSADNDSLVLIDEIGAGTDPVEGGALAAVILASHKGWSIHNRHNTSGNTQSFCSRNRRNGKWSNGVRSSNLDADLSF